MVFKLSCKINYHTFQKVYQTYLRDSLRYGFKILRKYFYTLFSVLLFNFICSFYHLLIRKPYLSRKMIIQISIYISRIKKVYTIYQTFFYDSSLNFIFAFNYSLIVNFFVFTINSISICRVLSHINFFDFVLFSTVIVKTIAYKKHMENILLSIYIYFIFHQSYRKFYKDIINICGNHMRELTPLINKQQSVFSINNAFTLL